MYKINQQITLNDGRSLGYAEYGSDSGTPVFHFHGAGSSRLERPASEYILEQLDIRFISVDRPGHGLSDFQTDRRLTDWPNDIAQLADHIGIDEFYVTGHSSGGPHVLVCAYQLPERIIAGAAISCVAPMSRPRAYHGMPVLNQLLARSSRSFPWFTKLIRRMMRNMVEKDVEMATRQLMSSIPDSDKDALYDPKNVEILVISIQEGFRQGHQGVALDDILVNGEWAFTLQDVKPRIDIWHGEDDVNVPFHAGQYLSDTLPNSREYFLPAKGHFFVLSRWEEIISTMIDKDQST